MGSDLPDDDDDVETSADSANESKEKSPHDELFKSTFQSTSDAASVLRSALAPELSHRIDWSTLEVVPTEHIGRRLDKRHSDVFLRARLRESGRPVYIEVLFEHQSSSDSEMPLRMLGMVVRRWEALAREDGGAGDERNPNRPLPLLLPVVLYQGENGKGWRHAIQLSELIDADEETLAAFRPFIPDFRFLLDDLDTQTDAGLHARALTDAALITLLLLRDARHRTDLFERMRAPEILAAWHRLTTRPGAELVFQAFWVYVYRTLDVPSDVIHDFAHQLGKTAEDSQMTAAQRLIDKVAPQLKAEGRVEGARATLKRLLALKFGDVPQDTLGRVEAATLEDMTLWTERILTANTVEELFR